MRCQNVYGGKVLFHWGVGKPFIHNGAAYVCYSKVGGFGRGFFAQNEGALLTSDNLLTESDPSKHNWETLPDGDTGLRTPEGGGPIAGEFNATPINSGSLFGTYRTIDGWSCHAYSHDDGHSWACDWMDLRSRHPSRQKSAQCQLRPSLLQWEVPVLVLLPRRRATG